MPQKADVWGNTLLQLLSLQLHSWAALIHSRHLHGHMALTMFAEKVAPHCHHTVSGKRRLHADAQRASHL